MTSCVGTPPPEPTLTKEVIEKVVPVNTCKPVIVGEDVEIWEAVEPSDLDRPLRDFSGINFLKLETARAIKNNNDKIRAQAK